jgi:hypothetical protein
VTRPTDQAWTKARGSAALHSDPNAVTAWTSSGFCGTLLAHPTSSAPADSDRRTAVRERVIDFNAVLAYVCAKYPQCKTDGGAVFRTGVTEEHISTNDYWHPSVAGQSLWGGPSGTPWDTDRCQPTLA